MPIKAIKGIIATIKGKIHNKKREYIRKKMIKQQKEFQQKIDDSLTYLQAKEEKLEKVNSKRAEEVTSRLDEKITKIRQLRDELENPFLLFVMGMGKYGKSTLINAFVGEEVAEVDDLPKTWKIDIFQSQNLEQATIYFNDGSTKKLSVEEAKNYLSEEEEKRKKSERKAQEVFENKISEYNLENLQEKEELKKEVEKKHIYTSDVLKVEWPVSKKEGIMKNFRLVDTPGLVQNLLGEVKVNVKEYYHQADGVIWLLDATKISAKKSRQLIYDLEKSLEQMGGRTDNIIAVLNKIDIVRAQEENDTVREVKNEAKSLFGDYFDDIIPISARDAFVGKNNGEKRKLKQSGILQLEQKIKNKFLDNSRNIRLKSKKQSFQVLKQDIQDIAQEEKEELLVAKNKRENLEENLNKDLNDTMNDYVKETKKVISNYRSDVKLNIANKTEELFYQDDELSRKKFAKQDIFMMEDLERKISSLNKRIDDALNELLMEYRKKSFFREYKYLESNYLVSDFESDAKFSTPELDTETGTFQLGLGIGAATLATIIFGPLGGVIAGLSSYFGVAKKIAVKIKAPKVRWKMKKHLEDATNKLEHDIKEELDNKTEEIREEVDKIREDSFQRLYGSRREVKKIIDIMGEIEDF